MALPEQKTNYQRKELVIVNISELLIEAYQLLDAAQIEDGMGKEDVAIEYLVILRKRLNEQPELEAGGAKKERTSP